MHINLQKKYYFIDKFNKENIDKLDKKTSVIFRNYSIKIGEKLILKLRNYCRKKKIKFYISNNIKIALKLNLDGVYIPSFNKSFRHLNYSIKKNFILLGSAHNIYDIKIKKLQNVEEIFLSSLFKKNKNYLGINKFRLIQKLISKKTIALGGISKKNIRKLNLINCSGFSGISYFK